MSDAFEYTPEPEDLELAEGTVPDEIKVNGKQINLRYPLAGADVAAELVKWGRILSEAERELELAKAHYRHWRAKYGVSIARRKLKLPEWRVNLELEETDNFLRYKVGLADAVRNVRVLSAIYRAWEYRADGNGK